MRKKLILAVVGLVVIGATVVWFWPRVRGPEQLRLPGTVEVQEVRLGSKIGGRVSAVKVRDGQLVEAGEVLVTFETPELTARRDRARAKLDAARAALDKANYGPRPEEVAEAGAAVDAAKARLAKMKAGYRELEKEKARHDLAVAQAEEKQAQDEFERVSKLYSAGAGGQMDYQNALAARDRARGRVGAAKAALDLLLSGYREEEIAEAQADLARLTARHELLRKGTRDEDKAAAAASVDEALAELSEAETNLRESAVIAPERCVVEVLAVRPGDLVQPGEPVARVLRADDLWVKVFVPATELGKLRLNQAVEVSVDSHPGKRFAGQVIQIATVSEFTPRNVQSPDERQHQVFAVKVRVTDPDGVFKSGMAAEVFVPLEGGV
ncbi:MAG: efflux RND transporter periplasmic adaptor subunit [Planctomycetia bacterium]|nr:efflux RND transporter periplasmic adaptor subunit [Planctomycetia bacterium]